MSNLVRGCSKSYFVSKRFLGGIPRIHQSYAHYKSIAKISTAAVLSAVIYSKSTSTSRCDISSPSQPAVSISLLTAFCENVQKTGKNNTKEYFQTSNGAVKVTFASLESQLRTALERKEDVIYVRKGDPEAKYGKIMVGSAVVLLSAIAVCISFPLACGDLLGGLGAAGGAAAEGVGVTAAAMLPAAAAAATAGAGGVVAGAATALAVKPSADEEKLKDYNILLAMHGPNFILVRKDITLVE